MTLDKNMKEICFKFMVAKIAGKVRPGQLCLSQVIAKQKKDSGYVAARGLCSVCHSYIKDGKFSKASESSLIDIKEK